MQSVLISIRPQWCEKIASGKKTLEIRKTRPKLETPFKCYIYCTAPKKFYKISEYMATSSEYLHLCDGKVTMSDGFEFCGRADYKVLNRKVIGEFVCDNIDLFDSDFDEWARGCAPPGSQIDSMGWNRFLTLIHESARLSDVELNEYFPESVKAYLWHISALQIYDKPKELSEFTKFGYDAKMPCCRISRPPQSWRYVEELEEPCKTKN